MSLKSQKPTHLDPELLHRRRRVKVFRQVQLPEKVPFLDTLRRLVLTQRSRNSPELVNAPKKSAASVSVVSMVMAQGMTVPRV
ncbi:hypothetical protein MKEN_00503300 [Mycena kentingensis (nom. inval.)]|nr:hypothetical protein MKEN_00503300 [Mycena kentingensis (nom. inval.)]